MSKQQKSGSHVHGRTEIGGAISPTIFQLEPLQRPFLASGGKKRVSGFGVSIKKFIEKKKRRQCEAL